MGSTSSNCCEMFDNQEEEIKSANNLAKPDFSYGDTASFEGTGIVDPRSPSSFIPRTPLVPLPSITITPDTAMATVTTDGDEIIVTQNKVQRNTDNQTPCSKPRRKILDDEKVILDPRSPSNAISRTPIANKGPVLMQGVVDPRSPSVEINRTPIVKVAEKDKDLKDPRSPSNGIERTPLKLSHAESLRRNVLLTNTLNASPSRKLEEKHEEQSTENLGVATLSPFNLSSLSHASVLDISRSSSARATCGSEDPSPNTSMEEFEFFESPATVFGDSKAEDPSDSTFSKPEEVGIVDAVVKKLITEITLVGDEEVPEIPEENGDAMSSLLGKNDQTDDLAEIVALDQVLTEFKVDDPETKSELKSSDFEILSPIEPLSSSDMGKLHDVSPPPNEKTQEEPPSEKKQEEEVAASLESGSSKEDGSIEMLDSKDIEFLDASLFSATLPADAEAKNKPTEVEGDSLAAKHSTGAVVVEAEDRGMTEKSIEDLPKPQNVDDNIKTKLKSKIPIAHRKSDIIKPLRASKTTSVGSAANAVERDTENKNPKIGVKVGKFDENQMPTKLHRRVLEKKGIQMGKQQQARSPLSVLGYNNSPESRTDLNRLSNKSRMRISKTGSLSVVSTGSPSPISSSDSDKFKFGKDN